jgi:fido (protein-threonine AMPylation protein)
LALAWNEDSPEDRALIENNSSKVLRLVVAEARLRHSPTVAMAQAWHRQIYEGASLPVWYFAGEIRDSDPQYPELIGYEVGVGAAEGVHSADVPDELGHFERSMQAAVDRLDGFVPVTLTAPEAEAIRSVVTLCALAHGEWIRIHPFANGNGRTARLWADWCGVRYGLPPFVRLKPRPFGNSYARAAARSMHGDHEPTVHVFLDMLTDYFTE